MALIGARRALITSSGPVAGPQAATFLARTSGLSRKERNAYVNLINGLVFDGIWSLLDGLYIVATNNTTTAALNLVSTSFSLVTHGSLTFNADVGYTGDGSTGYLDTQWIPATNGVNFTLNSATLGAYIQSTVANSTTVIMGAADGGGAHFDYFVPVQTGSFFWDINAATFPSFSNASPQGAWVVSRTSSTATNVYKNGSATAVGTSSDTAAATVSAGSVFLFAYSAAGTASNFTNYQASAFFFGAGLTSTQAVAINNRINTYMTELGHNVY